MGVVLLAVFFVGMNPPVVGLFNRSSTVAGVGLLYLWLAAMAVYVSGALVWIATNDAFALRESQIPPELREQDDVVTTADEGATGPAGGDSGGDPPVEETGTEGR